MLLMLFLLFHSITVIVHPFQRVPLIGGPFLSFFLSFYIADAFLLFQSIAVIADPFILLYPFYTLLKLFIVPKLSDPF